MIRRSINDGDRTPNSSACLSGVENPDAMANNKTVVAPQHRNVLESRWAADWQRNLFWHVTYRSDDFTALILDTKYSVFADLYPPQIQHYISRLVIGILNSPHN